MSTKSNIVIAAVAGAAFGAAAVQGLHAQAKLKAYSVSESEQMGTAPADYLPNVRKAIEAGHGRALRTLHGRVVARRERRLQRTWVSWSGTAWTTQWRSINRRRGPTWRQSVRSLRRRYDDMSSK